MRLTAGTGSQTSSSTDVQATVDVVATTDEAVSSTVPTTVIPTVADSSVGDGTVSAPVEYEAITGVLESSDHGPELCLGGMKLSLTPRGWLAQAANAPIDGIDMNRPVGEYVASQPDFAAWWVDQRRSSGHLPT